MGALQNHCSEGQLSLLLEPWFCPTLQVSAPALDPWTQEWGRRGIFLSRVEWKKTPGKRFLFGGHAKVQTLQQLPLSPDRPTLQTVARWVDHLSAPPVLTSTAYYLNEAEAVWQIETEGDLACQETRYGDWEGARLRGHGTGGLTSREGYLRRLLGRLRWHRTSPLAA